MKNTVPFTLGDYPVDLLNQAQMRQLKKLADEKGVTINAVIEEAIDLFAAAFHAREDARETKKKIIRFPAASLT